MPMVVKTRTALRSADAELGENGRPVRRGGRRASRIGFLSKQREEWVLVTHAREGNKLRGYFLCTLEAIGGTPSLLVGLASIDRTTRAEPALKAIMADQVPPEPCWPSLTRCPARYPAVVAEGFRAFSGLNRCGPEPGPQGVGGRARLGPSVGQALRAESRLDDRASC